MKILVLGTSLGLLISTVAWWNSRGMAGHIPPEPPAVASAAAQDTVRQAAVSEALRVETVQLRRALYALEKQVGQLTASPAASAATETPPAAWPAEPDLDGRVRQLEDQVTALAQRQESSEPAPPAHDAGETADQTPTAPAQDLALAYNTRLDNEARDSTWEEDRQAHFTRFFHTQAGPGARLQAAECRTTLCRLQVSLDDQRAQAQFLHSMSTLLEPDATGMLVMDDDNALHVTVYLSRSGYPFPAQGLQ